VHLFGYNNIYLDKQARKDFKAKLDAIKPLNLWIKREEVDNWKKRRFRGDEEEESNSCQEYLWHC
jgi:hypothetical protein